MNKNIKFSTLLRDYKKIDISIIRSKLNEKFIEIAEGYKRDEIIKKLNEKKHSGYSGYSGHHGSNVATQIFNLRYSPYSHHSQFGGQFGQFGGQFGQQFQAWQTGQIDLHSFCSNILEFL